MVGESTLGRVRLEVLLVLLSELSLHLLVVEESPAFTARAKAN